MTATTQPPFAQDPAHGNGTCEQCGQPCAVCGPRWCPDCYYMVDGRPRDQVSVTAPANAYRVIDGPAEGQSLASLHDSFEIETGDRMRGTEARTRYFLTAHPEGCVWSCAPYDAPLPVTTPAKAPDPAELGQRLLALRLVNNWTLNQAVAALGVAVPASRWHLWESGHVRPVREQLTAVEALLASAGL